MHDSEKASRTYIVSLIRYKVSTHRIVFEPGDNEAEEKVWTPPKHCEPGNCVDIPIMATTSEEGVVEIRGLVGPPLLQCGIVQVPRSLSGCLLDSQLEVLPSLVMTFAGRRFNLIEIRHLNP